MEHTILTVDEATQIKTRMRAEGPHLADAPLVEPFRLLALDIQRLTRDQRNPSIAVFSAYPKDGRSLVATFLARALAELVPPVAVLDADLNGSGLSGVPLPAMSTNGAGTDEQTHVASFGLPAVLTPVTSGRQPRRHFLEEIQSIISKAANEGLTLVVDCPAATVSSSAFFIAAACSAVVYVARRRAEVDVHREIRGQLDLLGANSLGVVFNEI